MKNLLLITSFLVYAYALPAYDDPTESNDPRNYKNIEILLLESAVDQDGGYSFSFENDDGSKVSQEGQREIVDDEHAIDRIHGSYSYNDVNGQPVSLTYTADENGFRPVGAHLPTPPPVPLEILRSLKFLATAKPFVDDQLYDYKPKKKVFRGRQYNTGNVVTRSRNNLRSNTFSESSNDSPTSEVVPKSTENRVDSKIETTSEKKIETTSENNVEASSETTTAAVEVVPKSTENRRHSKTETTSENNVEALSETTTESVPATSDMTKEPTIPTTLEVLNESKQNIKDALKETIEKTSKLTQSATKETANAAVAAIREEATKLTDNVKLQITKINDKISGASAQIDKKISEESSDIIEKYTELASDATVI